MASSTLSLKSLRDTSTLKSEISKLEAEKDELLAQLEREKKLLKKQQDLLLEQKKDFEHLEKQFNHFADIEAEFEVLQQEIQLERLENLLNNEKVESLNAATIKKAKQESKELQQELKEFKKLDPIRLKRQVGDLKKKAITQASENKAVNNALVSARKELKEVSAEKENLDVSLKAALNETHFFWISKDSEWVLYETGIVLKDEEEPKEEDKLKRVRCVNLVTGASVLTKEIDTEDNDKVVWFSELDMPEEVSKEAGKRLKQIASDLEDED